MEDPARYQIALPYLRLLCTLQAEEEALPFFHIGQGTTIGSGRVEVEPCR